MAVQRPCGANAVTTQWQCIGHARAMHCLQSGHAAVLQRRCYPTRRQRLCNGRAAVTRRLAELPPFPAPEPWEAGEDE